MWDDHARRKFEVAYLDITLWFRPNILRCTEFVCTRSHAKCKVCDGLGSAMSGKWMRSRNMERHTISHIHQMNLQCRRQRGDLNPALHVPEPPISAVDLPPVTTPAPKSPESPLHKRPIDANQWDDDMDIIESEAHPSPVHEGAEDSRDNDSIMIEIEMEDIDAE